jgi:hypothetical protein
MQISVQFLPQASSQTLHATGFGFPRSLHPLLEWGGHETIASAGEACLSLSHISPPRCPLCCAHRRAHSAPAVRPSTTGNSTAAWRVIGLLDGMECGGEAWEMTHTSGPAGCAAGDSDGPGQGCDAVWRRLVRSGGHVRRRFRLQRAASRGALTRSSVPHLEPCRQNHRRHNSPSAPAGSVPRGVGLRSRSSLPALCWLCWSKGRS